MHNLIKPKSLARVVFLAAAFLPPTPTPSRGSALPTPKVDVEAVLDYTDYPTYDVVRHYYGDLPNLGVEETASSPGDDKSPKSSITAAQAFPTPSLEEIVGGDEWNHSDYGTYTVGGRAGLIYDFMVGGPQTVAAPIKIWTMGGAGAQIGGQSGPDVTKVATASASIGIVAADGSGPIWNFGVDVVTNYRYYPYPSDPSIYEDVPAATYYEDGQISVFINQSEASFDQTVKLDIQTNTLYEVHPRNVDRRQQQRKGERIR